MSNKTESGTDLQQLKALALAATTGEWLHERAMVSAVHPRANDADGTTVLAHFTGYFDEQQSNAAFCAAASPAVVLDLIARIERATAPHADRPQQINLPGGETLRYEARTTGEPGWLLYNRDGKLLSGLSRPDVGMIEATIDAALAAPHGSAAPTEAAPTDVVYGYECLQPGGQGIWCEFFSRQKPGSEGSEWLRNVRQYAPASQRAAAPVSGGELPPPDGDWDGDDWYTKDTLIEYGNRHAAVSASQAKDGLGIPHDAEYWRNEAAQARSRVLVIKKERDAAMAASQAAPVGGELTDEQIMSMYEGFVNDPSALKSGDYASAIKLVRAAVAAAKVPTEEIFKLRKRIQWLETLADAYGPKSLQYDIEHPNDGLNAAAPVEQGQGAAPSEVEKARATLRRYWADGNWNEASTESTGEIQAALTVLAAPVGAGVVPHLNSDGRLSDDLRDLIEGMSVSIDVSTGEHDSGNRLFGVVSEVMNDNNDKCGVTLLVYDAKPNFTQGAGVVPEADPDAWIRKTDITELTDSEPETEGWTPLYAATAHPVAVDDQVRDQALEEAASACLCLVKNRRAVYARDCADAIRALKSRTTAHGGAQGDRNA